MLPPWAWPSNRFTRRARLASSEMPIHPVHTKTPALASFSILVLLGMDIAHLTWPGATTPAPSPNSCGETAARPAAFGGKPPRRPPVEGFGQLDC